MFNPQYQDDIEFEFLTPQFKKQVENKIKKEDLEMIQIFFEQSPPKDENHQFKIMREINQKLKKLGYDFFIFKPQTEEQLSQDFKIMNGIIEQIKRIKFHLKEQRRDSFRREHSQKEKIYDLEQEICRSRKNLEEANQDILVRKKQIFNLKGELRISIKNQKQLQKSLDKSRKSQELTRARSSKYLTGNKIKNEGSQFLSKSNKIFQSEKQKVSKAKQQMDRIKNENYRIKELLQYILNYFNQCMFYQGVYRSVYSGDYIVDENFDKQKAFDLKYDTLDYQVKTCQNISIDFSQCCDVLTNNHLKNLKYYKSLQAKQQQIQQCEQLLQHIIPSFKMLEGRYQTYQFMVEYRQQRQNMSQIQTDIQSRYDRLLKIAKHIKATQQRIHQFVQNYRSPQQKRYDIKAFIQYLESALRKNK